MILKYLRLYAPDSYALLKEITGQETQIEIASEVSKKLHKVDYSIDASIKTDIYNMVKLAVSSSNYKDKVCQTLSTIETKLAQTCLTSEEKEIAQQELQKQLYTQIGTHKEAGVVSQLQNTQRIHGYFSRYVSDGYTPDGFAIPIYIGGKIDAIQTSDSGDKMIIEVKNRMNHLFNKVVEYERVQVYAYMFIHDIKSAKIVEKFHDTIVEHVVQFDNEYWVDIIKSMKVFVQEVYEIAHKYSNISTSDSETDDESENL